MTSRVMVHVACWVAGHDASYENIVSSEWYNASTDGSAGMDALVAQLNADAKGTTGYHYAIAWYYVWYADGGWWKGNSREFKLMETSLGAVDPSQAPDPLVPTPEA